MTTTTTTTTLSTIRLLPPPSSPTRPNFLKIHKKQNGMARNIKNMFSVKARVGGGGSSVLERPTFDQSQFDPSSVVLEGGDIGRLRDKRGVGSGDSYRVLLLDDPRHSEKLVAKIVPQVVPLVTPDGARKLFHESRENGIAVVIVTVKEHAEFYSQMLIRGGLRSTIEPDSNTV